MEPGRHVDPARGALRSGRRPACGGAASPAGWRPGRRRSPAAGPPRRRRRWAPASRARPRGRACRGSTARTRRRRRRGPAGRRRPGRGSNIRSAGSKGRSTPRSACDLPDLADRAVLDERRGAATTAGWKRVHMASMAKTGPPAGGGHDLLGAGDGGGEGLLDQHGLAGLDRRERQGVVLRVRGGDVEDVDVVGGDQLGVGAVRGGDPVLVGEGPGPVERSGWRPRPARRRRRGRSPRTTFWAIRPDRGCPSGR